MINKQNATILMSASAIVMSIFGGGASFFPQEILGYFGIPADEVTVLLVKIIGGLYFGFAVLNWTARRNLIGGIYSRPVSIGNFAHFFIVTILLLKQLLSTSHAAVFSTLAIINGIFAVSFTYILFCGNSDGENGTGCG